MTVMVEDRFVTSEEKLLKVIRKQDKIKALKPSSKPSGLSSSLKKDPTIGLLKFCNRLFLVVSFCFLCFLVYKYFQLQKTESEKRRVTALQDTTPEKKDDWTFNQENLGGSVDDVMVTRDIFEAPWEKPQTAEPVPEAAPVGVELKTVIRVSGIILDQNNPQVIVEDVASGETTFLSKGQNIKGATLLKVEEGKATFDYQGQMVELTM